MLWPLSLSIFQGNALSAPKVQRSVVQELPSGTGAKPLVGTADFAFDINLSVSILIKAESRTNATTLILHIRCPFWLVASWLGTKFCPTADVPFSRQNSCGQAARLDFG
jgi:hypothetical protein